MVNINQFITVSNQVIGWPNIRMIDSIPYLTYPAYPAYPAFPASLTLRAFIPSRAINNSQIEDVKRP